MQQQTFYVLGDFQQKKMVASPEGYLVVFTDSIEAQLFLPYYSKVIEKTTGEKGDFEAIEVTGADLYEIQTNIGNLDRKKILLIEHGREMVSETKNVDEKEFKKIVMEKKGHNPWLSKN